MLIMPRKNIEARREYAREWYGRNKNRLRTIERVSKRRLENKRWFNELKSKLKCEECGENHPACLDFHHIDGRESINRCISRMSWCCKRERVIEEIKKCKVLCANCHRKEQWNNGTMGRKKNVRVRYDASVPERSNGTDSKSVS